MRMPTGSFLLSSLPCKNMIEYIALVDQDYFNFTDSCPVRNHITAHLVKQQITIFMGKNF